MAVCTFTMVLKWRKMLSSKTLTLGFERDDGQLFEFTPGQFITLLFETDDGLKRRSYSLATIPNQNNQIELVLTLLDGGAASERLMNLTPGESLKALGPVGRLVMQEDDAKRYVMIGTSTGIAPYRTMLPALTARIKQQLGFKVVVVEGVQYRDDLLYADDFLTAAKAYPGFEFYAKFSQDSLLDPKDYESKGHVQTAFDALALNPLEDVVYLCGNPNMIDQNYQYLIDQGFDKKSVRREKYISSN